MYVCHEVLQIVLISKCVPVSLTSVLKGGINFTQVMFYGLLVLREFRSFILCYGT